MRAMNYDIDMKPVHGGLEKISIAAAKKLSDHHWFNRTLCNVNDAAVRIGVPRPRRPPRPDRQLIVGRAMA